jgi:hypothetical protein
VEVVIGGAREGKLLYLFRRGMARRRRRRRRRSRRRQRFSIEMFLD